MDIRSWKRILMQWITECGFMELNVFNIEQSDIDEFFSSFCKHHFKLGYVDVEAGTTQHKNELINFLKENYPEFQPLKDDTNDLSPADYLYVYSLLLHYSCVKSPDTFFHEKCQKLSENAQQAMAAFFNELLNCSKINKESLRHAIADISTNGNSPRYNDSNSSSSSGNNSLPSPKYHQPVSPIKTPKKERASPSTPKSFLLDERTRELYTLRAQLDTERYEKGLLEVEIKQYEDKMTKLNQDHKKLKLQIQDLKNDLFNKSADSTATRDEDEQIKRRMCKELSLKEQEISKLTDIISVLTDEKSLAQDKLILSDKQIILFTERLKELDYKNEELSRELEKKCHMIKYLSDSKEELENYVSEIRSNSANSRADLNNSLDSSNGPSSPENLGSSVVDVKLREKEIENSQLRAEMLHQKQSSTQLAKHIQKLVLQYSRELQIDIEYINSNDEELLDPAEHFMIFANCMDRVGKWYKNEINRSNKLQDELMIVREKNERLSQSVEELSGNIEKLKTVIERLEKSNCELESIRDNAEKDLSHCTAEINGLNEQKFCLEEKYNQLTQEYEAHWRNYKSDTTEKIQQIETLKIRLEEQAQQLHMEQITKHQLLNDVEALQMKLHAAQEKLIVKTTTYDSDVKALNQRLASQKNDLEAREKAEKSVKEKYEELLILYEEMKRDARETDAYLSATRDEISAKEQRLSMLGKEIIEVRTKNTELEDCINKLMEEYKQNKNASNMTINLRDARIKEMENELSEGKELHLKIIDELNSTVEELNMKKLNFNNLKAKLFELNKLFDFEDKKLDTEEDMGTVLTDLMLEMRKHFEHKFALETSNNEYKDKVEDLNMQLLNAKLDKENMLSEMNAKLKDKNDELMNCCLKFESEIDRLSKKLSINEHQVQNAKAQQEQEQELELVREEKIQYFEEQLENILQDNENLRKDLDILRNEHLENYNELNKAIENVNSVLLVIEEKENTESSNSSMKETPRSECSTTLDTVDSRINLTKLHNVAMEKIKVTENRVCDLEEFQKEQAGVIKNLMAKLKETEEEKEILTIKRNEVIEKLDWELHEKSVLLGALESTTDKLKTLMEDHNQLALKDDHINNLNEQLAKTNEQITLLESNLVEQETELRIALDEHQQEIDKWRSKFSETTQQMNTQLKRNEFCDKMIGEIIIVLDRSAKSFMDNKHTVVKDDFFTDIFSNDLSDNYHHLKSKLNILLSIVNGCSEKLKKMDKEHTDCMEGLTKTNAHLNTQNNRLKTELNDLQKQLANKAKLGVEIMDLNANIRNLDNNNEALRGENAKLIGKVTVLEEKVANFQMSINMLNEKEKSMKNDLDFKDDIIKQLKEEERRLSERTCVIDILNEKLINLEHEFISKSAECEQQALKLKDLQLEIERQRELKVKIDEQCEHNFKQIEKLNSELEKIDNEMQTARAKTSETETHYSNLMQDYTKLRTDYDVLQQDYNQSSRQCDENLVEIECLKTELANLEQSLLETKLDLSSAKELCTERDGLIEENCRMKAEIEQMHMCRVKLDMKFNRINEKMQNIETKLLDAENHVTVIQTKLQMEYLKLRKENEAATHRMETVTQELTELKVLYQNSELSNAKLNELMQTEHSNMILEKEKWENAMHKLKLDNEDILMDSQLLKEQLNNANLMIQDLNNRIEFLEDAKELLEDQKLTLETDELDSKMKILSLEKLRESNKEKIRKLEQDLMNSEQLNVSLNLEIGAVNSKLEEIKKCASIESEAKIAELTQSCNEATHKLSSQEDLISKLNTEIQQLKLTNSKVSGELSEMKDTLLESKEKCELLKCELSQMLHELEALGQDHTKLEESFKAKSEKLLNYEMLNKQLNIEKANLSINFESKIHELREELAERNTDIDKLKMELETLRIGSMNNNSDELERQLESMRIELSVMKENFEKEQQLTAQLRVDNQILQAKYREAKQRIADEMKNSEERLKENRLEMEGKLEKMKNKMTQCHLFEKCETGRNWKNRFSLSLKYFSISVVLNMLIGFFLSIYMRRNGLELVFKSNTPSVF